ncbi:DUF4296 domain-containing protein [Mucilaginibacter ginsenosidivorax]|uniref:DUF4296 domain-containing protein n=1 Tax=Mucilaginibacter ginsenosidivorax TaxID=862126 RepID=A0A5B8VU19_9SPHI|nr:DUF4296 domain-containing protein [Mucilaginibacter ginsenosidivorax]QEC75144.1 DUF4296 domain-containing protein [Mucilaginibacter ginsenosidivorax]
MYKYLTLFFSVTLFLCGCKSDSVPSKFIQPQKMTGLLVQIHLIDGSLYNGLQGGDSLYKYGMGKYLDAFRKFDTDSAQFRKSMQYYASEPDKLFKIYDSVEVRIKTMSDSVNLAQNKQRATTQKADSLKADSVRKALLKPKTPAQKADSVKQAKIRERVMAHKADSLKADLAKQAKTKRAMNSKIDSAKKLKHRKKLNAVPN